MPTKRNIQRTATALVQFKYTLSQDLDCGKIPGVYFLDIPGVHIKVDIEMFVIREQNF